jgi:hypothetical protein
MSRSYTTLIHAPRLTVARRLFTASIAGLLVISLSSCGGDSGSEITTQDVERTVVNFGKKKVRKAGDLIVTNGYILDRNEQLVGRFDLTETLTGFVGEREIRNKQLQMTWSDSDDSLVLLGTHEHPADAGPIDDVAVFVVVGGTGRYDGARGKAEAQFDGQFYRWRINLL